MIIGRSLNAYPTIRPLTVPVRVVSSVPLGSLEEPVDPNGPVGNPATGALHVGLLGALVLKGARAPVQTTPAAGGSISGAGKPTPPAAGFTWSEAIEKSAKGVVAAGAPLSLTALPNVATAADLSKTLVTYNVAPNVAKSFSDTLFASLKSEGGFAFCVGAAGGVLTLFVLDAAKVRWALATKMLVAVGVAVLLGIVALVLVEKGVLQKPGSKEVPSERTAPSSK
ncbi:MAG TPA: hypothetical protein VMG60_23840 [Burkholderiaceae bacterium]|nr:hypothetical protein [Burkholderiaceae bacterium]